MPFFYPFSNSAPQEYRNSLNSSTSKVNSYTQGANITPMLSLPISTILGAIQIALDKIYPDDVTKIDNGMSATIVGVGALGLFLTGLLTYLKNTETANKKELIKTGVTMGYFANNYQPPSENLFFSHRLAAPSKRELTSDETFVFDSLMYRST